VFRIAQLHRHAGALRWLAPGFLIRLEVSKIPAHLFDLFAVLLGVSEIQKM
jgi:hypothetical protein